MCCTVIIENPAKQTSGKGWKVICWNEYLKRYQSACVSFPYELGKWMLAQANVFSKPKPEPGFHIYRDKEAAEACLAWYKRNWGCPDCLEIVRVEYRNATLVGLGDGGFDPTNTAVVIVAQEMLIPLSECSHIQQGLP